MYLGMLVDPKFTLRKLFIPPTTCLTWDSAAKKSKYETVRKLRGVRKPGGALYMCGSER